jgi:hypothetical protein
MLVTRVPVVEFDNHYKDIPAGVKPQSCGFGRLLTRLSGLAGHDQADAEKPK